MKMNNQIIPQSRLGSESGASPVHILARRVCLGAGLGLLAILAFVAHPAQAAVTEAWVHRYTSPANGYDEALAVAVDGEGNVVVTGYSAGSEGRADYYTAKYAAAGGALLWEQRYNGPANGDDYAYAVAVDADGNVVVTGTSYNATNADFYTAKYAAA